MTTQGGSDTICYVIEQNFNIYELNMGDVLSKFYLLFSFPRYLSWKLNTANAVVLSIDA